MHTGHGIIPLLCMPVMISYPRLAALIYPASHLSIVTSFPISLHPPSAHPIKLDPIPIYLNQPQPPIAFPCFVCANPTSLLGSIVALSHVTMTLQRRIPTPFPQPTASIPTHHQHTSSQPPDRTARELHPHARSVYWSIRFPSSSSSSLLTVLRARVPSFLIAERAGTPRCIPKGQQSVRLDERMGIPEEDVARQIDQVARMTAEMRPGFHEFGAEDPDREG